MTTTGSAHRWLLLLLVGATAARGAIAGPPPQGDSLFHEVRAAMGTTFDLFLYAPDAVQAEALAEAAFEEIERIEATFSTYRASSELSRINRLAGHEPVTTDPEVFGLLERARVYSAATGGAFDITVGALMKTWGFFRDEGRYPPPDTLARARTRTGWRHLLMDARGRTVAFAVAGLELDVGGIGKGYALDRVAALLRAHGVHAALIGSGTSSFVALGAPPGEPGWAVRVPLPFDREQTLSTVYLRDGALSTSGNYERFFDLDGRRYSHIIDPRTGVPADHVVQVTVVAPTGEASDALSTAVFVLGPGEGAALLADRPGTGALLVSGTPGTVHVQRLGGFEDAGDDASFIYSPERDGP